jgi:hypothetical protein
MPSNSATSKKPSDARQRCEKLKRNKRFLEVLKHEHGLPYLVSCAVINSDRNPAKFEEQYGFDWYEVDSLIFTVVETCWAHKAEAELIIPAIRAAFELGYIEQAMKCQQVLQQTNSELWSELQQK